jgi:hypothetical protein
MLDRLAEIGMDLAETVRSCARGEATPEQAKAFEGVDLSLAFARIARAVRQTVALKAKLADEGLESAERRHERAVAIAATNRRKRQIA